jgi:hypothetical protein
VTHAEVELANLLRELATRCPPVRIVVRPRCRRVATLGRTIYVPAGWTRWPAADRFVILRHELVHVAQFERYGWLGTLLLYALLPLPIGLAYGRARLEWEAFEETLRATAIVRGPEAVHDPRLHEAIVRAFTGPAYGFMWPFPGTVRRWIADVTARRP